MSAESDILKAFSRFPEHAEVLAPKIVKLESQNVLNAVTLYLMQLGREGQGKLIDEKVRS